MSTETKIATIQNVKEKRLITSIVLPIRLISEANNTDHWAKKHARKKQQQSRLKLEWLHLRPKTKLPCEIHLTRFGKKEFDYDNLVISFKAIRDQLADLLIPGLEKGVADSSKELTWHYKQQTAKFYGIQIEIFA